MEWNYNKNSDGTYMSEDQIVEDIINNDRIDEGMIEILSGAIKPSTPLDKLGIHLSMNDFGRWLRNAYGLWQEDNPCVVLRPEPNTDGIIDHPLFPDNLAGRVIDRLTEYYTRQRSEMTTQAD